MNKMSLVLVMLGCMVNVCAANVGKAKPGVNNLKVGDAVTISALADRYHPLDVSHSQLNFIGETQECTNVEFKYDGKKLIWTIAATKPGTAHFIVNEGTYFDDVKVFNVIGSRDYKFNITE